MASHNTLLIKLKNIFINSILDIISREVNGRVNIESEYNKSHLKVMTNIQKIIKDQEIHELAQMITNLTKCMLSKTLEMIVMTHDNIKIFIEAADHLNANQSVENFLNKYRTLTSFLSSLNIKESQTKRDIILRHIVETAQRLVVERTYYLDMVEFHNYISTLNKFIEEETKKKYK